MTSKRKSWWSPPVDNISRSLAFGDMPSALFDFVWRVTALSQIWVSFLAIAVFILNTAPLELQRRILNAIVQDGNIGLVLGLALAYAGIVFSEGLVKLLMKIYRGWLSEKAVRALRLSASALAESLPESRNEASIQGIEVSLILAEPEPIGAFAGVAISEPVLQIGILFSVFGYMFYTQPLLAFVSVAMFSPQLVFVPPMQRAINQRVQSRIAVLRQASIGALPGGMKGVQRALQQELRFAEIFRLNLGIFELKYSMNFFMNLLHNFSKAVVLGVGGWYVINGQTEVGIVVAFISGLDNINDPWGDLVNWFQDMMVNNARYEIYVDAMRRFQRLATVA